MFFYTSPKTAVLADANPELINAFEQVRSSTEHVIERLHSLQNSYETYYAVRSSKPICPVDRAVRFLYLMRLSFNGIYRENLKGEYNVPYGRKVHLHVCDEKQIRTAACKLRHATLAVQDFRITISGVNEGDVLYVDPPYTVLHNNNGFVKYNQQLFSWNDQVELAEMCRQAYRRGAIVIVSNADCEPIRSLYSDFQLHHIDRFSSISANAKGRAVVSEAVFIAHTL